MARAIGTYKTVRGAQRYNTQMDKVYKAAIEARRDPVNKSHRRHNQKLSKKKK